MSSSWVHAGLVGLVLLVAVVGNLLYVGYKDGANDKTNEEQTRRLEVLERHDEQVLMTNVGSRLNNLERHYEDLATVNAGPRLDALESDTGLLSSTSSRLSSRVTRIEVLLETQFNHIDDRFDRIEKLIAEVKTDVE